MCVHLIPVMSIVLAASVAVVCSCSPCGRLVGSSNGLTCMVFAPVSQMMCHWNVYPAWVGSWADVVTRPAAIHVFERRAHQAHDVLPVDTISPVSTHIGDDGLGVHRTFTFTFSKG